MTMFKFAGSTFLLNPFLSDEGIILTGYRELQFSTFIFKFLKLLILWEVLLNPEVKRRKNVQVHKEAAFYNKGKPF